MCIYVCVYMYIYIYIYIYIFIYIHSDGQLDFMTPCFVGTWHEVSNKSTNHSCSSMIVPSEWSSSCLAPNVCKEDALCD